MMVGSTPTTLLPSDCSAALGIVRIHVEKNLDGNDHSCHVGTSSPPCFSKSQLSSSCFSAWLKYRPSVAKAAFSDVITAVPAEPENPVMYPIKMRRIHIHAVPISDLDVDQLLQCILIGGYLQKVQLKGQKLMRKDPKDAAHHL